VTIIITGGSEISGKIFQVDGFILGTEGSIIQMMLNGLSSAKMLRYVCLIQIMSLILQRRNKLNC
jgi:hypothetical protein